MRIISGKARGTNLYTLKGMTTRPTLDRVKESLFNIIQNKIPNCLFLDLFAGSGAIGLEAASRGAEKVILCDKSKEAIEIIRKNIEKTHMNDKVELYNLDYESVLRNKITDTLDIIYIDPPYESEYAIKSIEIILEKKLVNEKSIIIVETDNEEKILKELENLPINVIDQRKYGRASIIFLKK